MSLYDNIASFYDIIQANKYGLNIIKRFNKVLEKNVKKTSLDIACGTGDIVNYFYNIGYYAYGLDNSKNMLKIAKKKYKNCKFFCMDMCNFNISKKFDVISCIYETINHLSTEYKWIQCLKQVYKHLNNDGVFIFDMETISYIKKWNQNFYYIYDTYYILHNGKYLGHNKSKLQINIFAPYNNMYKKYTLDIKGYSMSIKKLIKIAYKIGYSKILILNKNKSDKEDKLYVCLYK